MGKGIVLITPCCGRRPILRFLSPHFRILARLQILQMKRPSPLRTIGERSVFINQVECVVGWWVRNMLHYRQYDLR